MTSGLAPAIRSSLESNTEFQRLLFQVNDIVHRLVHEKQTRIHIGVACNWGKHRSVAFAEAVAELLLECTELPLDGVECHHLERWRWDQDAPLCPDLTWGNVAPLTLTARRHT